MSSLLADKSIFKALVAGGVAASIDIIIYKNNNYKATMLLASTVSNALKIDLSDKKLDII